MDMYLNSSESMQALKGKRLVLNCTATGELNTRVNITWDYPGKVRPVSNRLFRADISTDSLETRAVQC